MFEAARVRKVEGRREFGKERLYKTARIRSEIGFDHIAGMLPGEIVSVKYWKHEYDVTSRLYRPVYFISKTPDLERHKEEGSFATVFNCALEDFSLITLTINPQGANPMSLNPAYLAMLLNQSSACPDALASDVFSMLTCQ